MRVLIVRPEPGNSVTAAAVRAMGPQAISVPLFDVVPVIWDAPDPSQFDAVAMTSANAARHGGTALGHYRNLPVFAVGETTGAAARDAGFATVMASAGDAAALGETLSGRILHLAGVDFRPIPTRADVTVRSVYASLPAGPAGPLDADVALVHSARAGERLASLMPDRSATILIAISDAAARASGSGWAEIHIAANPADEAMLACLARLCKAGGPSPESPVA